MRFESPAANPAGGLLTRLSSVLNRSIQLDEKLHYRLREMGCCSIALKLRGSDKQVFVEINDAQLLLSDNLHDKPDVQIEGGVADFIAMARARQSGSALAAGRLEIQGDLAIAQQVQTLVAEASFDWEDLIAARTGGVLARQIGRGIRGGTRWLSRTRRILERDVGEYLLYEIRLLPSDREVEQFVEEGTRLASGVEKLNARVQRIRQMRGNR